MMYEHQLKSRNYPFDESNIATILDYDLSTNYKILFADMVQHMRVPFEEWLTVTYECDTYPRYHTTAVGEKVMEYLADLFIPEFDNQRVGWFVIPANSIGPFHYDKWRNTSVNLDMKVDTGSGLYFFENPPHQTGRVIHVAYPDDRFVMLNVREGHMILNESATPRVMLTISFQQSYHELLELYKNGELYRE